MATKDNLHKSTDSDVPVDLWFDEYIHCCKDGYSIKPKYRIWHVPWDQLNAPARLFEYLLQFSIDGGKNGKYVDSPLRFEFWYFGWLVFFLKKS